MIYGGVSSKNFAQGAIDFPRAFHFNNIYQLELGVDKNIEDQMKKNGHETIRVTDTHGGGQAIKIDWKEGLLIGGSDPRKDGFALGI